MSPAPVHTARFPRAGTLVRLLSLLLGLAVWTMPMITTAPGVHDLCLEHDLQVPSPLTEEEEETKQAKPLPGGPRGGGPALPGGSAIGLPGGAQLPAGTLLEVPCPPPRTLT